LPALEDRIGSQVERGSAGSYSARLLGDPALLRSKLIEEAGELAGAAGGKDVAHEAADVLYFTLVAMRRAGVAMADVAADLDRRALRITRRPGNAKTEGGTTP
jgi:phosphoribosyl-ATP pyrophosphohydrolase